MDTMTTLSQRFPECKVVQVWHPTSIKQVAEKHLAFRLLKNVQMQGAIIPKSEAYLEARRNDEE